MERIFFKNLLKNKEIVFENGVKNIQAAAYNGARTVDKNVLLDLLQRHTCHKLAKQAQSFQSTILSREIWRKMVLNSFSILYSIFP